MCNLTNRVRFFSLFWFKVNDPSNAIRKNAAKVSPEMKNSPDTNVFIPVCGHSLATNAVNVSAVRTIWKNIFVLIFRNRDSWTQILYPFIRFYSDIEMFVIVTCQFLAFSYSFSASEIRERKFCTLLFEVLKFSLL